MRTTCSGCVLIKCQSVAGELSGGRGIDDEVSAYAMNPASMKNALRRTPYRKVRLTIFSNVVSVIILKEHSQCDKKHDKSEKARDDLVGNPISYARSKKRTDQHTYDGGAGH